MKQQCSKHYTAKSFKMAGSSKVKALRKQSNKGSRFTHWVVKTKWVFELGVKDDILVKGLDCEKQRVSDPGFITDLLGDLRQISSPLPRVQLSLF